VLTVQASVIVSRARRLADAETPTPSTDFVTDTELYVELTSAARELADVIIAEDGGIELLATSTTLTSPYTFPADFYRHVALDIPGIDATMPWKRAMQFPFSRRNDFYDTNTPRYRVMSGALVFSPSNAAPTSVRLWYVAVPTTVSAGSDLVLSVNGWDDYIVGRLAEYICSKEERDATAAQSKAAIALARIKQACKELAIADTQRIADVESFPEEYLDLLV
jgi:hypothetical protein